MPVGTYLVQVQVKGEFIPFYQYTNQNDAKISVGLYKKVILENDTLN